MVYVDTSVWIALLFAEVHSSSVAAWFSSEGRTVVSAEWARVEFESALALKCRSGRLSPDREAAVREAFGRIDLGLSPWVPVARTAMRLAAEILSVSSWALGAAGGTSSDLGQLVDRDTRSPRSEPELLSVPNSVAGLRAGGALHLAVAREVGASEFATVDRVQARAAVEAGLVLTFPDSVG